MTTGETTELEVPETLHIEATPEPAPAPETEERPLSKRDLAMAEILRNREAERAKEIAYAEEQAQHAKELAGETNPELIESQPEPEAPAAEPAPLDPEATAPVAAPASAPNERRAFDLGNGQVIHLTEAEVAQFARLGMATQVAMSHQPQQAQPAPQPVPPPQSAFDETQARNLLKSIAYGNEDEGVHALQEFIGNIRPAQPQIDPNALAQYATQQAYQRMRRDQDLQTVANEFPEIFGKPGEQMTQGRQRLTALATIELQNLHARYQMTGAPKQDLDLYREACENVVNDLSLRQPPQPAPVPTAIQAALTGKDERKRAAPRIPAAANRTASLGAEVPRPPTGSEIVAQMRKSRFQPPLN